MLTFSILCAIGCLGLAAYVLLQALPSLPRSNDDLVFL